MSTRTLYSINLAILSLLLFISIYLQWTMGLKPCPLCTLQRLAFVLLVLFSMIGIFSYKHKLMRTSIDFFISFISLLGALIAGRHIWLQHFPSATNSCAGNIEYLLQILPFDEVLKGILSGNPDCNERGFVFLIFNLPEWAFLWFSFFLFIHAYLFMNNILTLRTKYNRLR